MCSIFEVCLNFQKLELWAFLNKKSFHRYYFRNLFFWKLEQRWIFNLITLHDFKFMHPKGWKENINESNEYCYQLNAVVNYISTSWNSGHYYVYIRFDNRWFLVYGENCRSVPINEVINHLETVTLFLHKMKWRIDEHQ